MKIAVLLSGTGRTLENILRIKPVALVISSKPDIRGNEIARNVGIPLEITKDQDKIFDLLGDQIDLVCLAGWVHRLTVPDSYKNRIMNIHPSLLPMFGGQGMYGHHVHEAVLARGCKMSGCTVHFVDNQYDHGPIILQSSVPVLDEDTPERLASRVFAEECALYPRAIQLFCQGRLQVDGIRIRVLPAVL